MKLEIFNQTQEYNSDLESYCDQNCVLQVLRYLEVKNPLSYFNTSLNLHIIKTAGSPLDYELELDNELLLDAYKSKIKKFRPTGRSNMEIWEENKARLKEGIPLIAGIDVYYPNHSINYRKFHGNHKCILCGYTEDDRFATVIDCYEWKYKGNIALGEFIEARSSVCPRDESPYSGIPIDNIWLEADESNWSVNVREALKETFDITLAKYYENTKLNSSTDFYGVEALKKIHEIFSDLSEFTETEKSKFISDVRIIFLCLYTRLKLFRYYVKETAGCIHKMLLSGLLESLEYDIEQWHRTSMMLLKATFGMSNKSHKKIMDKIGDLIISEEKRYKVLMDLYTIL